MSATQHHSTILCNSYSMGLAGKTRKHTKSYQIYGILLTSSGGNNASNARRYTAFSQGSSTEIRRFAQHDTQVHREWRASGYQSGRTNKSETKCYSTLSQQECHKQRRAKLKAAFSRRQFKSFEATVHIVSQVVQTTETMLVPYCLYADSTLTFNQKSRAIKHVGGGWR